MLLVFFLDQFIKNIVLQNIDMGDTITVIPKLFYLTYVKNTGGAWSIMDNYPIILTLISFICLIGLNYYLSMSDTYSKLETIYLGLIMGGILGNFIDRVLYDGVIDFISIHIFSYQYPIFNIADIMIVVGFILILIEIIWGDKDGNRSKERKYSFRSIFSRRTRN